MTEPETSNTSHNEIGSTDNGERLDRIRHLQSRVAALGPVDPDFDMKTFTDKIWEKGR